MTSTILKITEDNIQIDATIKITVKCDTTIELTFEEAKCLYSKLKKIVGENTVSSAKPVESDKINDWLRNLPKTIPNPPEWPKYPNWEPYYVPPIWSQSDTQRNTP